MLPINALMALAALLATEISAAAIDNRQMADPKLLEVTAFWNDRCANDQTWGDVVPYSVLTSDINKCRSFLHTAGGARSVIGSIGVATYVSQGANSTPALDSKCVCT